MELKGKEFDIGGLRIQVDPLVVGRRVILYRLRLLVAVAVLGGAMTVGLYLLLPKVYESRANVVIRTDALGEHYSHQLLNTASRNAGSNEELMLIINELDLFSDARARLPYDVALERLRNELLVGRETGSLNVRFESRSPIEAQRVVAFVVERILASISDLLDSPYARSLEALNRGLRELDPRVSVAQKALFEFQAAHPEVAVRNTEALTSRAMGPLQEVNAEIRTAEADMKRCFAGGGPDSRSDVPSSAGPECRRLEELTAEREQLLRQFTESHPAVTRMTGEMQAQAERCRQEQRRDRRPGLRPGLSVEQCQHVVAARLQRLHTRKAEVEMTSIRKPGLQGKWAKVSAEANQLESQQRALLERKARTIEERLLAANSFQENFQLVDPPRVPGLPSRPNRQQIMGLGMLLTGAIGIALAGLLEALRQTFKDPREIPEQTGLVVIADLPAMANSDR